MPVADDVETTRRGRATPRHLIGGDVPQRIAVIGAGWAGTSAARKLHDAGVGVHVFERATVPGGHSRSETLGGVVYEPNGAHIFHTSDEEVAVWVQRFGLTRPFQHKVFTRILDPETGEDLLLSWPPQIEELSKLRAWPVIEEELAALPPEPSGEDFETFVVSMMGPTLYHLFIYGYTRKQWGMEPTELSSRFAPKRVDLRSDGDRRLFRDTWEFFSPTGVNHVIERILEPVDVSYAEHIDLTRLSTLEADFDEFIITAPLDAFVGRPGDLQWRGVELESEYLEVDEPSGTVTEGYVINHPSESVPFTRTIETKHATGQQIHATVVSRELPGSMKRHYPIVTPDRRWETANETLKTEIRSSTNRPLHFCGRLANYQYINQDQAIRQGFDTADLVLAGALT
jgi:UDP-galactopyranose mutase